MPEPESVYFVQEPRFKGVLEIQVNGSPALVLSTEDLPMALQDAYATLIGDGKARVAVTVDVGIKDFGTGVSSSCTVVLTCNQDEQTIQRAASLAGDFARDFAKENRERADLELQQLQAERERQSAQMPR